MRVSTVVVVPAALGMALSAAEAGAQAWLPPKGEATLALGFLHQSADQHFDYQGTPGGPGDMIFNNVVSDLSYGVTDRLAVRLNVPFVISKYGGNIPHPIVAGRTNLDDGSWHSTFQDLLAEVRFRATQGPIAVTPFVAVSVPTHDYPYYGHGAAGRKLVEGQFGVAAGRLLDPVLPNAYLQVRYMYGVPEKVLGISHNRSQVNFELGYLLGPAFTIRALGSWQKSHGGWRATIDWPALTNPDWQRHDQLARSDYFRLGGGVSYSLTGSVDVNLFGYGTVSGKNEVNMRGVGVSFTWSASPAQLIKKKRGQELQQ
jgi:hypothetical protein